MLERDLNSVMSGVFLGGACVLLVSHVDCVAFAHGVAAKNVHAGVVADALIALDAPGEIVL